MCIHDTSNQELNSRKHFFKKYFSTTPHYITIVLGSLAYRQTPHLAPPFGSNIEIVNYDCIGTLVSFNELGPVRLSLEYDIEHIEPAHACIDKCVSLLDHYKCKKLDKVMFHRLLKKLEKYSPVLKSYHLFNH